MCECNGGSEHCFGCPCTSWLKCKMIRNCRNNIDSHFCAQLLEMYSCGETELCEEATKSPQDSTTILVPVLVCVTIIILVTILAVTLALYWRFRIKVLEERRYNRAKKNKNVLRLFIYMQN